MTNIIEASGLVKTYKEVIALDGLDLEVEQGTVLALLGPNGAGKTTAVSIFTTLLEPDSGWARVAGADVLKEPNEVRKRIGLSGQNAAVDLDLTGYENLDMVGRLYHLGKPESRSRARELLETFGLAGAGDRPVKTYSGGMKRRLDLAAALVARSEVIFLDEPTTGLDPRSRIELWKVIEDLVAQGSTLLLTTQYLEEADRLASDILVIDHGNAIAHGTADELKAMIGGERIEVRVEDSSELSRANEVLAPLAVGETHLEQRIDTLLVPIQGGAATLTQALRILDGAGIAIRDVGLRRPTLDDVFLTLTGHVAEEIEAQQEQEREEVSS